MQTIEARVKVGGDRKLTIDLPNTVLSIGKASILFNL
jgi:hypothetical protein